MPFEETDGHIELFSGATYAPGSDHTWSIIDIAHSLANQCRYTGHSRHFYSVAEHSILCSMLAEELGYCDPFEALMHDAHESVISDMAAPWKPHLSDYRGAERVAEGHLRAHYDLPDPVTLGCKKVDYLALFIEAYYLMHSKGEGWSDPLNLRVEALKLVKREGWKLPLLEPSLAKTTFIERYRAVKPSGK